MKNLLVPLDGSELAEAAVRPALALAARHEASVHLAYVVSDIPPVPLAFPDRDALGPWMEGEELQAGEYMNDLEERLAQEGANKVTAHVKVGPVVPTILTLADNLDVDLVVLTTHGRGAWERVWLGSVADEILRHETRPLLLLRADGQTPLPFGDASYPASVLVPLDGSKGAESVLGPLEDLLPAAGSRLILAAVLHQPLPTVSSYLPDTVSAGEIWKEQEAHMTRYLEEVAARLQGSAKGEADVRIVVSHQTARSLLQLAEEERVDLIAVSTHGRGGLQRLLLGSIADKLVRGAEVPILATHRTDAGGA